MHREESIFRLYHEIREKNVMVQEVSAGNRNPEDKLHEGVFMVYETDKVSERDTFKANSFVDAVIFAHGWATAKGIW